jgi:phosphohistidine phosphatase
MGAMAAYLLGLQSIPKPVNPGTIIGLDRGDGSSPARLLFHAAPGQPVIEEFPP